MNRQARLTIFFLSLVLITGCGPNTQSTENRRVKSIQFEQKNWANSEHKLEAKMGREVLDALKVSNTKTLQQPEIASACIVGIANRTNLNHVDHYDLFVLWLEDQPSINQVEFSLPGLAANLRLPISDADANINQMVAKQSVVFTARNQWKDGTEIGNILDNLTDGKNLKVRLLMDKEAVTDWYPVSFIKLDHWVVEIPNPHSGQSTVTNSP